MSIDKSLKSQNSLVRHRNVLTRGERLIKLEEDERWEEGDSVMGLAKVLHRKATLAKKEKAKTEEGAEAGVEGTAEVAEGAQTSDPSKSDTDK